MRLILLFWFLVVVATFTESVVNGWANNTRPKFDTYKVHAKTNGFDHRPKQRQDRDLSSKIRGFFEKKRLINILQNPNIPTNEKMQIIDETINHTNILKSANIFAGGLMSEWDFDMQNNETPI